MMEFQVEDEFVKAADLSENEISEDDEIDEQQHGKLLESVTSLRGKKGIPKNGRSEPSLTISEFNTIEGNNEKIKVHELLSTLKQTNIIDLKKQVRSASRKSKVLPTPLPRVAADKIKRSVAYQEVGEKVSKWDSIVISNRLADHMEFPLKQANLRIQPTKTFVSKFKPKTPLELEVAKLLNESENTLTDEKPLTVAEDKFLKAMSYEEAKERLDELRKMRALLSYQEAKAHRQKKIKSKRYHRILKKERIRKDMKEFDELKKSQPELAAEKLLEIDKLRIEERMSLKHKNTGKWAKQHALRAKYNKESRDALSEQLEIGKTLREKRNLVEDSNESDEDTVEILDTESEKKTEASEIKISNYNPWFKDPFSTEVAKTNGSKKNENNTEIKATNIKTLNSNEIEYIDIAETVNKEENCKIYTVSESEEKVAFVQYSDTNTDEDKTSDCQEKISNLSRLDMNDIFEMNKLPKNKKKRYKKKKINLSVSLVPKPVENIPEAEIPNEELIIETLVKKNKMEDFEKYTPIENVSQKMVMDENNHTTGKTKTRKVQVDPTNFVMVKVKNLKSKMPKQIEEINDGDDEEKNDDDDEIDDDEKRRMTISEAFADDDVLEEFRVEKRKAVDEGKPQMLSAFLPGWGAWGGEGIKESRKKIRRFRIKPPPTKPRADRQLGNVIIKDGADSNKAVALHMISDLPYPFTNVQQFERSLAQPIGNTWNPESAFANLVIPKVETKRGKIIDPIDSDALIVKKAPKWGNDGNVSKVTFVKNKSHIDVSK